MSPLKARLVERIRRDGPLPVADYMAACLDDPEHGYYRAGGDPLGEQGDFTTAPEISQVFGELVGLWLGVAWQGLGAPAPFTLAEAGPGRGTLMADLLRAVRHVPGFADAARLHLVESSPALRRRQAEALPDARPTWHDGLETLPDGPLFLVANEFLDALPVRQVVFHDGRWCERVVTATADGALAFAAGPPAAALPPGCPDTADAGTVAEHGPAAEAVVATVARHVATRGGAALFIDYGPAEPAGPGDTLQAVRGHAYSDPLAAPGETDLTAHVAFPALADRARAAGAAVHGPVPQGDWLLRLGVEARADRLARAAPDRRAGIGNAVGRLIQADGMGTLFKVMAVTHPRLGVPAGFEGSAA